MLVPLKRLTPILTLLVFYLCQASLAAAPHPTGAGNPDERAVVEAETAFSQVYVTGDSDKADRLLDTSFVAIDPSGNSSDKQETLSAIRQGPKQTSAEILSVKVRVYGNAAVAQGKERDIGPPPERRSANRVWTDTWIRKDGHWRMVASEELDPDRR